MRKLSAALMLVAAFLMLSATVAQGTPSLRSFGTGDVTIEGDAATIVLDEAGEYGGVYLKPRSLSATLSGLEISFRSTADVAGGAPRFSIPIDDRDPATKDTYAFLAADRCGGATGAETVVFGLTLTQVRSCIDTNLKALAEDPFIAFGSHTQLRGLNPGKFKLIMHTGGLNNSDITSDAAGNTQEIELETPSSIARIDSWAAIVE